MPARIWDTDVWVADNRKIRDVLGWQPHTSLEEGFRRTVDWFRLNSAILPLDERKPT
jgi:nucleoside-diphosphate-sugar epimerase